MYHVYLLKSQANSIFYIGYTKDIVKRLEQHNAGVVGFTRKYRPWSLVYYESYISLIDAQNREQSLKHFGKAYTQLKVRLKESLGQIGKLNKREGAG
jgi:putative endonuclease